ncbi:loricrin-like [Pyrus ussuriensis x Pyrus communis]|uniref:Loricrin-like n=1 Tax=Pyrus ussuriensis x Pyrus communis TaxID=2448454 RepID=A0A5N5HSY0_9ROSA|nr:loricrin-like [Pyrus ussuriensis x Pyrus communis]
MVAIIDLCSNYPILNPDRVAANDALKPPKRIKGAPDIEKEMKMKKLEKVVPKEIHVKVSKKKIRLASSFEGGQDVVPEIVDLTSLAYENLQQAPVILGGERDKSILE